jgi:hypothetical protein
MPQPVRNYRVSVPLPNPTEAVSEESDTVSTSADPLVASYTDCMEICILRVLHTFLQSESRHGQVDLALLSSKEPIAEVLVFFETHNSILTTKEFTSPAGVVCRTAWAQLLVCRPGFRYKLHSQAEV